MFDHVLDHFPRLRGSTEAVQEARDTCTLYHVVHLHFQDECLATICGCNEGAVINYKQISTQNNACSLFLL